jgi:hypothetical protein
MRNQSGSINLILLAILPLILAVSAVLAASYLTLKADAKLKHLCRNELLASQETVADRLNKLIKLNPLAKALRAARSAAEKSVLLAPTPEAKAAAQLTLDAVIAKQSVLATEQRALYTEARAASQLRPLNLKIILARTLYQDPSRQDSSRREGNRLNLDFKSHVRTGSFEIEMSPKDSLTPDYRPSPRFAEDETVTASWAFNLKAWIPEWTKSILGSFAGSFNEQFKGSCSAGVEKGDLKWTAKLKVDKLSSNSFSGLP